MQGKDFGHDTETTEVLDGIDLSGKVVLITGGSSGIGEETARAMADKGANVIITARSESKAVSAVKRIRAGSNRGQITWGILELGSLASVRAFAANFLADHPKLHVLINNAGVMACPHSQTSDGFELQFGSNHIGHFLLTGLLAPALISAAPSRIICLSSVAHHMSPIVFEDIQFQRRRYSKWRSYGQSKTANALHAVELQRRLGCMGVKAFSVHPGEIRTNLGRHLSEKDLAVMQSSTESRGRARKNIPAGAATTCYAATAPELDGRGGEYLEDCHIAQPAGNTPIMGGSGVKAYAQDLGAARKLWEISEELVGQKFSFDQLRAKC